MTHEYASPDGAYTLYLGDRLHIVDGDPDWKHGMRVGDHHGRMLTFPATCVAALAGHEQPMKLVQNVHIAKGLRLYRDQVVFAQPDSIVDNRRVLVRNERGTKAYCLLQYLTLL